MNSIFYKKYLKYKRKYLYLKNQVGGSTIDDSSIETIDLIVKFIQINKSSKYDCKREEMLTRIIGKEIKINNDGALTSYTITKFLGKGGFGCVFKISNNDKIYVIKLGVGLTAKYEELGEARILDELMSGVVPNCNYKAISYGGKRIKRFFVYFIIFNFKGDHDLFKILASGINSQFISKYIKEILTCLIEINKKAYHGDLKPENIAIDEHNTASIIDYGFAKMYTSIHIQYPKDLQDSETFHLGIVQTSIDIFIAHKMVKEKEKEKKISEFNDLYTCQIQKNITNYR